MTQATIATGAKIDEAFPPRGRPATLSSAALGVVLVVDQLLLPMFHLGDFPYKISYFIVGLWFVSWLARGNVSDQDESNRDFLVFAASILTVIGCSLLGELWFASFNPVMDYGEAVRSVTIYILVVLSFGMGLSARSFNVRWLVWVFYISVALNFAFIFVQARLPAWLVDIYYSQRDANALAEHGVTDVQSILEMIRPRGLFGNPNVSALMVNVIVLFILLSIRKGLIRIRSVVVCLGILILPLALSAALASRGEFVVSLLFAFLNFKAMYRTFGWQRRFAILAALSAIPIGAALSLAAIDIPEDSLKNVDRILTIVNAADRDTSGSSAEDSLSGVSRPLLTLQRAWDRFKGSPLFGTGFSMSVKYPYNYETQYFHNDWFRVIVTSGLLGLAALLYVIRRFCLSLDWPTIVPFVLPGIVNTFQLDIPAFMFYFFMIGAMRAHLRSGTA